MNLNKMKALADDLLVVAEKHSTNSREDAYVMLGIFTTLFNNNAPGVHSLVEFIPKIFEKVEKKFFPEADGNGFSTFAFFINFWIDNLTPDEAVQLLVNIYGNIDANVPKEIISRVEKDLLKVKNQVDELKRSREPGTHKIKVH